jgi:hyperosmotically inducible protein
VSTYAHNVKIISKNGKVTLKGPVRSEDEKKTVESKAVEVAGAGNVTNELTIKPDKNSNKADREVK